MLNALQKVPPLCYKINACLLDRLLQKFTDYDENSVKL